jgi:hypothetical protein
MMTNATEGYGDVLLQSSARRHIFECIASDRGLTANGHE